MRLRVLGALVLSVLAAGSLSADTFEVNAGGGNWSNLATWTQNGAPATRYPGQLAGTVDTVGGTVATNYTVTVDVILVEAVTLTTDCPSNTSTCLIDVGAAGMLKITGDSAIGTDARLRLSGGTVDNAGNLTIAPTADFDVLSGTLTGAGSTILAFDATLPGQMNVSGGVLDAHSLNVNGKVVQTNTWSVNNGGTITIEAGGIYDLQAGNIATNNAATSSVTNNGTLKKTGAGASHIDAPLNNNSLVDIQNGGMVLGADPTHNNGDFVIGTGLGMELRGTCAGTCDITGGGTVFIVGTPTVSNGSVLNMVNVTMNAGWLQGPAAGSGTANVSGTATFAGGVWRQNLIVNMLTGSTLSVPGTGNAFLDDAAVTIASGATMSLSGGTGILGVNNGSSITNNGTIDVLGDLTITSDMVGSPAITNNSTVNKSGGTATTTINCGFNNAGSVSVTSGVLELRNGGLHAGTWFAGTSGGVAFNGGVHQFTAGSMSGSGTIALGSGTMDVDFNLLLPNTLSFQLTGGTLTGNGVFNLQGPFLWTGGQMDNSSGNGSTVLQGPSSQIASTTAAVKLGGRTISNVGTFTYNPTPGSELSIDNGGQFLNTGTFDIVGDAVINSNGVSSPRFTNGTGGVLNKSSGTGSATFFVYFSNNQTINLSSGSIRLKGGGQELGTVTFGASGTNKIVIDNCIFAVVTTPVFTGSGILEVTGASASFNMLANVNVQKLELRAGGQLTGTGTLTISNSMLWEHGSMTGTGVTTIANTAVVDATTPTGALVLNTRTLTNDGTINWNGTSQSFQITGGAVFNNNGTFTATGNGAVGSATGTIVNSGTFEKTGGTSGTRIDSAITNSGTLSSEVSGHSLIINGGGSQTGGGTLATSAGAFLDFFGGTFTVPAGTAPFSGSGTFRVNGGTLAITGSILNFPLGATMAVQSGALDVATSATFQVSQLQWTGGTLQGNGTTRVFGGFIGNSAPTTLTSNHTLTIPAATFNYNADMVNYLTIAGTANLNIENGGGFYLTGNTIIGGTSTDGVTVAGTFHKTGSGVARIDVPLVAQTGTVVSWGATGGTLQLNGGGSSNVTATVETALSGIVEFSGGTFTMGTGTTVNGTGTIAVNGGTLNVDTAVTFPTLNFYAGTVGGSGALTLNGGAWFAGTMTGTGTTTVAASKTVNLMGGGSAVLARTLIVDGMVGANNTLTFTGAGAVVNNGNWNDAGTSSTLTCSGCTGRFTNSAGALFMRIGGGVTSHTVPFDNNGTVRFDAMSGSVGFNGGGNHTGDFDMTAMSFLSHGLYFGGTHSFSATSDTSGTGFVYFNGTATHLGTISLTGSSGILIGTGASATFNTASAVTTPMITISGDLGGTGAIDLTGSATSLWNAGTISGSGAFTIGSGATFDVPSTSTGMLNGRTITNNGTFALHGNIAAGPSPGAIVNNSGFRAHPAGSVVVGPPFTNTSLAQFGLGSVAFNGGYTQTAGTTELIGGTFTSPFTVNIDGGIVRGNGTIGASVINDGTFSPGASAGAITVNGNYTQSSTGVLDAEIGGTTPGTQYDQLIVTGNASLDGTINVTTINSFTPSDNNVFDLVTWGTRSGTFATVNLPSFAAGTLNATYEPTAFRVTADFVGDLGVTKSGPANAAVGSNVSFTIQVKNFGPSAADNVVVSDPTPANLSFVSNSGDCTTAFPCNLGTVGANVVKTITATYAVTGGAGTSITNTASVTTTSTDNVSTNNSGSATVFVDLADLGVTKSGPANAAAGSNVSFTIQVKNFGPSAADNVVVSDPTPANLTFVSNSGDCTTAFPCNLGTVGANVVKTITATYAVTGGAGTSITNTASVTTTSTENVSTNNSASATVFVDFADLAVTKSGPASASFGSNVSFTIQVKNVGPSAADSVVVSDPTPANLTFVSNGGDCATAFPCSLGTIPAGATRTITATYTVSGGAGSNITNTASATSTTAESTTANNSGSATVSIHLPDLGISKSGPANAEAGEDITFTITISNGGQSPAQNVVVSDPTPAGLNFLSNSGACTTPFPCNLGTVASGETKTILAKYSVSLGATGTTITNTATVTTSTNDDPANNSASATVTVDCDNSVPGQLEPTGTAAGSGTLSWRGTGESYVVYLGPAGSGCTTKFAATTGKSVPYSNLAPGTYEWRVESLANGCRTFTSACATFTVPSDCVVPAAPVVSVVGQTTSAKTYEVLWDPVLGATRYEVEESTSPEFNGTTRIPVTGTSLQFRHDVTQPTAFYYRVFAFTDCTPAPSAASATVRVVIVPLPPKEQKNPSATVPAGSEEVIVQQVFIPGEASQNLFFTAATDRPWLTVRPEQGVITPAGITLDVVADPKNLPNGTFTASVIVTVTTNNGTVGTNGTTTVITPISVNLVTPVTPVTQKPSTSQYALIIPSAGHLPGIDSQWQSDIRVTNAGFKSARYQLTFTPSGGTAQGVKQTTITVDAGATTALDDIVRNWFGLGALGDGVNGMLEILPLDDPAVIAQSTVASSRTYNVTGNGTLGQYIPAVPFPSFIGRALPNARPQILSLQQIAQNAAYRTNVGLAEAGGASVDAVLTVFSASGDKLTDIPVSLAAGEQRQLNQLLALHGIELADGRIEVKVTGGDGKVTAYASVVDSGTHDPLLVSGELLTGAGSSKFVLAGVANLDNAVANWRTDMRVFNYGTSSQPATLTFFPFNNGVSKSVNVLLAAGQVMTLDNVLKSQFDVENQGGVIHLSTPNAASLVVTGRTYNQTGNGTFGQFIPAVTAEQAVGAGGRTLHILQVEDSTRYRTNVGLAEVTGRPVMVELQVVLPDSKITPTVQIPLAANEFRQFNVIRELGVGNVYNARITVRVVSGDGRVTAYGSVIDELTQDPTYVPAQ